MHTISRSGCQPYDVSIVSNTTFMNVNQLFAPIVQYVVDSYVGDYYVWNRQNWQSLSDNMKEKTELRVDGTPRSHFIGVFLTYSDEEENNEWFLPKCGIIPQYEVIDGKQRLTTFQIILCVIRDLCQSDYINLPNIAASANLHIKNENHFVDVEKHDEQSKFLPRTDYGEAFRELVHGQQRNWDNITHQAYRYFWEEIKTYVAGDSEKIGNLFYSIILDFYFLHKKSNTTRDIQDYIFWDEE